MTNNNKDGQLSALADINLTPFVDLMMVLLIIFMITAPLMQQGLDVNLPQAQSPIMEKSEEDVILTIKADGSLYLGDEKSKPVTLGLLGDNLSSIFENRKKKDLYIRADEKVFYGRVVSVMSAAKSSGVERIGMVTKPLSGSNKKEQE